MPRVSQSLAGKLYNPPTDVPMYRERVAFERRVSPILAVRAIFEGLMRSEDNLDGRGTVIAAPSSVNGTETRGSARWKQTSRKAFPAHWNMDCYTVHPDGSRTPYSAPSRDRKSIPRQSTRRVSQTERLVAIIGTHDLTNE